MLASPVHCVGGYGTYLPEDATAEDADLQAAMAEKRDERYDSIMIPSAPVRHHVGSGAGGPDGPSALGMC